MTEPVPVVVVPGFAGHVLESDGPPPFDSPLELLQSLWLSLLEGREDRPGSYVLALPDEAVLSRELLPDPSIEELEKVLAPQADAGRLLGFAYDWRRDLTSSAARLSAELVEHATVLGVTELDVVAIGPGSLIVRYLLESGALPEGEALVRRTVHLGSPGQGIPGALLVLNGVFAVFEPEVALREMLASFPSALQMLPPRGTPYVHLDGSPGVRIDPFSWPEALLAMGEGAGLDHFPVPLLSEAAARNDTLHSRLKSGFHPSWRQALVFASASEPTYSHFALRMQEGQPAFVGLERAEAAGDGLVPVVGTVPGPGVRSRLCRGAHGGLARDPGLLRDLVAFLSGPIA